eukprot:superscaffoldBa00000090_g1321
MPTFSGEDIVLLMKANKKIADLKGDIQRLSDELQKKDSLLCSFTDVATGQSKQIANLSAAIQDTVLWDPSTCTRPSSSSTRNHHSSWAKVVACGRKRSSDRAASPPRLTLSNHYTILSDDFPAPADAPAAPTDPSGSDGSPKVAPDDTASSSPPVASSVHTECHSSARDPNREKGELGKEPEMEGAEPSDSCPSLGFSSGVSWNSQVKRSTSASSEQSSWSA